MAADTGITWNDLRANIHTLAKKRGWHHGVPIMSSTDPTRRVVLAKGCPLADIHGHGKPVAIGPEPPAFFACKINEEDQGVEEVNTWQRLPLQVVVMREKGRAQVGCIPVAHLRLKQLLDTLLCQSGTVSMEAEFNAMVSLFKRLNENQRESYMLSGAFPETSKRSGVTYILRKGRPTLAIRCTKLPEGGERRNFLAALCSHPLGWYEGTWAGVCPPSDEVLGNLLAIRADEHKFWARSIQHSIEDPLAGI